MNILTTPYQVEVYRIRSKDFSPQVEVVASYIRHKEKYLLLHRAEGTAQEHTWGVPGGKVEEKESPRSAVMREVVEETGFQLNKNLLNQVGTLYIRYPHMDFVYHMFSQEVEDRPDIFLSNEHQDYCWLSMGEAFNLPLISGAKEAFHHFLALEVGTVLPRKSFYFVRHGETDVNANPHIKRVNYDLPLNQKGREQALSLRNLVQNLPFKKVICSPIQRAQETKNLALDTANLDCHDDERFSECCAEVWTNMVMLEEGSGYQVCNAVQKFLSRVLHGLASSLKEEDPVFIVAHGGIHWAICYHMNIENHPWKIGNCEIVHFEPHGESEWKARIVS